MNSLIPDLHQLECIPIPGLQYSIVIFPTTEPVRLSLHYYSRYISPEEAIVACLSTLPRFERLLSGIRIAPSSHKPRKQRLLFPHTRSVTSSPLSCYTSVPGDQRICGLLQPYNPHMASHGNLRAQAAGGAAQRSPLVDPGGPKLRLKQAATRFP